MIAAKGQAERYARSLPVDHNWPPFLIVTDVGYCLDIWADFSGTGRAYTQFPDRARYRIMLEDLRDPDVRERLRCIWTDPLSLDPAAKAARVTRQIADLLAKVAKRLEARDHNPDRVSGFLMRLLFTMFAEDSKLIPEESFTGLLKAQRAHPQHLAPQLSALWRAMDKGEFAPALGVPVKRFNGYLFKDRTALDLEADELEVLIQAAEHKWTEVEPAIFGTLLERALNPKERAKLGAHYTPRAYVERLIAPTIMEPLRADWDGVRTATASLIDDGKTDAARSYIAYELDRMAVKHGEVSVPNGAEAKAGKTLMTLRNGAADEFRKEVAGALSHDEREALSKTRSVTATVFAQFPWASIRLPKRVKRYARKRRSRHIGTAVHDRNGR